MFEREFEQAKTARGIKLSHQQATLFLDYCLKRSFYFSTVETMERLEEWDDIRVGYSILGLTRAERRASTLEDWAVIARLMLEDTRESSERFYFHVWIDDRLNKN